MAQKSSLRGDRVVATADSALCLDSGMDPFTVQALDMGLINTVVPLDKLQEETTVWCREILRNSPTALRVLKAALNAAVSLYRRQSIACASYSPVIHLSSASNPSHTSPL